VLIGIWFFGIGLVVAVIYAFTLGRWLTGKQSEALRYWLDGTTLRLDQGVSVFVMNCSGRGTKPPRLTGPNWARPR
jgi:hypothetical protein